MGFALMRVSDTDIEITHQKPPSFMISSTTLARKNQGNEIGDIP